MNAKTWFGFYGAAGTVTGSRTLINAGSKRILVDCGLFQGTAEERLQNWQTFPFDHTSLDGVVVTHAHLDHSGALPLLVRRGYKKKIYCTEATADLLEIMLKDSAKLQEEEAEFRNRRGWSKHQPAEPLYSVLDVDKTLRRLVPVAYDTLFDVAGFTIYFARAAHIVGSAHVHVTTPRGGTLLLSGDIGRGDHLLLGDVPKRPGADVVIMESTYGDRRHPAVEPIDELCAALAPVLDRGGVALIPAFAVGRAQEILVAVEMLVEAGRLPRVPMFLDSPMATRTLHIQNGNRAEFGPGGAKRLQAAAKHTKFTLTADESKAVNAVGGPAIIVSASGMLTGGRILHHLMERAHRKQDALILTGFQARGTRGRRIADGEQVIKIFGQPVKLELEVKMLASFSAHADQEGLLAWLASGPRPQRILVNHGEPRAASALVQAVRTRYPVPVVAAVPHEKYTLPEPVGVA